MEGKARALLSVTDDTGVDPGTRFDSDEHGPPIYADLVGLVDKRVQLAADADEVEIEIPACCYLLLASDYPVVLKLATGETALRTRLFQAGAEDELGAGIPATTLLLSGTGDRASVRIVYLEQVV